MWTTLLASLAWITIALAQTDRAGYLASANTVRGVNLGGWLVTESWYVPVLALGLSSAD